MITIDYTFSNGTTDREQLSAGTLEKEGLSWDDWGDLREGAEVFYGKVIAKIEITWDDNTESYITF